MYSTMKYQKSSNKQFMKMDAESNSHEPKLIKKLLPNEWFKTFKAHLFNTFAGAEENSVIYQCNKQVSHKRFTLLLLQQSNVSPNVPAYAYHHNPFAYNWMTIGPLGCVVESHTSWCNVEQQWAIEWYVGTSPKHYTSHFLFAKAAQ